MWHEIASMSIFPTVQKAEEASRAIQKGGPCDAHPKVNSGTFQTFTKCDHYRVGNVLMIVPLDGVNKPATARDRETLQGVLRKLGTLTGQ